MPPAEVISMLLSADPVALSVVRERFQRWLAGLRWPDREVDDVVMAVNEAVTLAIGDTERRRAEVRVAGRLYVEPDGSRRVMIGVAGAEGWCPDPATRLRGAGLLMIHACMDTVEISDEPDGTTLMMSSVQVPPLDPEVAL